MSEEMAEHLHALTERYLAEGMSSAEAAHAAQRDFGGLEQVKEEARGERIWMWPAEFLQDIRFGWRALLKSPGFTIVAVVALALGIGANTAIFSVVNAVLLRPLPFKNPDQLVLIWESATHLGFPKNTPSPANFLDWQRQSTVFTGMAAMAPKNFNLTGSSEPERLDGRRISANLFDVLGVQPQLGRGFQPQDDKHGAHVVLLSDGLWERRFGADSAVIGRTINLNGESFTVIGVMPPGIRLPGFGNWRDQLWVPMAFPSEEAAARGNHYLEVIARRKPGVSLQQAQVEMDTVAARLARQYPEDNLRIGATVISLHDEVVGEIRPALLILLGAVAFVLLIACANVANLLLARAAVREKEIALRHALGATRSRIVRQLLAESMLLALLGGVGGLFLAFVGLDVLQQFIPDGISQAESIAIDGRVFGFTAMIAIMTGLVFGLVPSAQASHFTLNEALKEGGRDSAGGGKGVRLRGLLVVAEVAVSFVLLIGAGLLINSFLHLRDLDPGFRADHLLTAKIEVSEIKYPDRAHRIPFLDEVLRRVRALPGVQSAALAGNLPLTYNGDSMYIGVEGIPDPPPDQQMDVIYRAVGPSYFHTMGIPLLQGRDFNDQDTTEESSYKVIVSEKLAQHYWPGKNPIGQRLKAGPTTSEAPWREVVGVVKDVRQNDFIAPPKLQIYLSYRQLRDLAPNALVIRTSVEPLSLASAVRGAVWAVDKNQPVSDIASMEQIVAAAVARQRFSMLLLALFAGLALLLVTVGIYGVMSYSVTQRSREIGIRMALGAQKSDVLRMTLRQGLRLAIFGVAIGIAGALVLTRLMASLLFGVSATDPTTFAAITIILSAVALFASYIPALRAVKVDPMIALRYQ